MKKLGYLLSIMLIISIVLSGCSIAKDMTNTPTKKVEEFLNKYQSNDKDVINDLENIVDNSSSFTTDDKQRYIDLMKKHYQDMTYDVKNEKIDGNTANVEVAITVRDYSKVISEANKYKEENPDKFKNDDGVYDETLFTNYKLEKLEKVTDTISYTLNLALTKKDGEWTLDDLSSTDEDKLNGTYTET